MKFKEYYMNYQIWLLNMKRYLEMILGKWKNLILFFLKESGAFFIVITHYPEAKVYAENTDCIVNARMAFDRENLVPLYKMEIGEAGESCAFYIASRIGMPFRMIERAAKEAYGEEYDIKRAGIIKSECKNEETLDNKYNSTSRIVKKKKVKPKKKIEFHRGDSVMVYPDKKIGIVCKEANEKGVFQVQMPGKKIWINYKRLKLHVAATELYPEDYDFSIIFDSVEVRKARHQMERKYVECGTIEEE